MARAMVDLEGRYDMRMAAAWTLGHARRTGTPTLPGGLSQKRVDDCSVDELLEVVSAAHGLLVEDYGARVRIVYLETSWETLLERNRARASSVPERMIERLLQRLEPPTPDEAHGVAWVCV